MKGSFGRITEELERNIGQGNLVAVVGFDGPYAVAHHEMPSHSHAPPSWKQHGRLNYSTAGTGPGFISKPLFERYPEWLRNLAADLYEPDGANRAMERAARDWKSDARRLVPRDSGGLRDTATAIVVDNGRTTYSRRGQ